MSAIIIALPKLDDARKIQQLLVGRGYSETFAYSSAAMALQSASEQDSGVIICSQRLPDMFYLDIRDGMPKNFELVVIGHASTLATVDSSVLSVTMPIRMAELVATIDMIFSQIRRRIKKNKRPGPRTEQEKNFINNAKRLLMDRNGLSEEEAFRYIQKYSMDNRLSMVETAQILLEM